MLNWIKQFSIFVFLDSNAYPSLYSGYECLLAVSNSGSSSLYCKNSLLELETLHNEQKDWLFGHICYDYKKEIEPKLTSSKEIKLGFPDIYFFIPETVCFINKEGTFLTIESFENPDNAFNAILGCDAYIPNLSSKLNFSNSIDKTDYIDVIKKLKKHIADGDCYEINYCTGGFCEQAEIDPLSVFCTLNKLTPAPFAAYYRLNDTFMMCASPERYLKKDGIRLISQPIKGTAPRSNNTIMDKQFAENLRNSIKEQAENVMIVDLVRNDLARSCETGTVQVEELFGIYSFPQVHQMISTVSGVLGKNIPFTDALKLSFPMGSMTGAPKYKVMELIEQYELSRRELFSGSVGYITPEGDFDFNVIIRSLFYNSSTNYLSYQSGGAITYDSNPENEWEEMRLKASAMRRIFE